MSRQVEQVAYLGSDQPTSNEGQQMNLAREEMASDRSVLRAYRSPLLQELGDVRTLTLGGSPGATDSGGSLVTRPIEPLWYGDIYGDDL